MSSKNRIAYLKSNSDSGNISAKYKIPVRKQEEIDQALNERHEMMRFKCLRCCGQIYPGMPFARWQTMEFCTEKCLKDFLLAECSMCDECTASIAVDMLADNSRRIGTELKHFCSSLCAEKCATNTSLCTFCFRIRAVDENKANPCSAHCEKLSKIIDSGEKALAEGECTDCETFHRYETELIYRGEIFGFCSFKCFFFLKFTCGIYAGNS